MRVVDHAPSNLHAPSNSVEEIVMAMQTPSIEKVIYGIIILGICEILFLVMFLFPPFTESILPSAYCEQPGIVCTDEVRVHIDKYSRLQSRITRLWLVSAAAIQAATSVTLWFVIRRPHLSSSH
jgi:hypothetical protein